MPLVAFLIKVLLIGDQLILLVELPPCRPLAYTETMYVPSVHVLL